MLKVLQCHNDPICNATSMDTGWILWRLLMLLVVPVDHRLVIDFVARVVDKTFRDLVVGCSRVVIVVVVIVVVERADWANDTNKLW
jgi:hypothetical protein